MAIIVEFQTLFIMASLFLSVRGRFSVPRVLFKHVSSPAAVVHLFSCSSCSRLHHAQLAVVLQVPVYQPMVSLIEKSHYHTSTASYRKSGSSALEPKVRLPSNKQIKRKTRETIKTNIVNDREKEKMKVKHMKQQFESGEVREFIEKVREK